MIDFNNEKNKESRFPTYGRLYPLYFILKIFIKGNKIGFKNGRITLCYMVWRLLKIISENVICKKTFLDGIQDIIERVLCTHFL